MLQNKPTMKQYLENLNAYIDWSKKAGAALNDDQIKRMSSPSFKSLWDRYLKEGASILWGENLKNNHLRIKGTKSVVPLLSKAIKTIDLNKSEHKARIRNSPWVYLPNVAMFNISLSGPNLLLKYFGLTKSLGPILHLSKYRNRDMNRFIEHQVIRLEKYRNDGNSVYYWTLAKILMKRSNTFRVSAFQHVYKNWHRNLPLWWICQVNRKVSKLINEGFVRFTHHRVYIDKAQGGHRPLGVPAPEWRIYLHMLANFLTFWLEPKLHPNQHAYLPGRGTLTAWKQIFVDKLYKQPFIAEWDFKGFFDNLYGTKITDELLDKWVDPEIAFLLEKVNRSTPTLPEERKLNEDWIDAKAASDWSVVKVPLKALDIKPRKPKVRVTNLDYLIEATNPDWEMRQLFGNLRGYLQRDLDQHFKGVAQGAPTSPILANLMMDLWLRQMNTEDMTTIGYADDSVSFSSKAIKLSAVKPPADCGIIIHKEKSGVIKRAGIWKGSLKFLGLKFDGKILQGATRKGSELIFNSKVGDALMAEQVRLEQGLKLESYQDVLKFVEERVNKSYAAKTASWENYFKTKLIGFVQSRLYQGNWNLENLEQDFNYKFINNSWSAKIGVKHELDIFNSSSFACHSLNNIFRWNQKLRKARQPVYLASANQVW